MAKRLALYNHVRRISCSLLYSSTQPQIVDRDPKVVPAVRKKPELSSSVIIDLKNTKGISVKHVTKETEDSALFHYCLEADPSPDGFIKAVDTFKTKNKNRQGHINFIATGIKFIEPYKLQKDEAVYLALMDIFPREKFKNKTVFDAFWPKSHPQINLALDILTKMEWEGMLPSQDMHDLVHEIFGSSSFPLQKIYRMWFWMQEFHDLNPYELPEETYKDRMSILKAVGERFNETEEGFHAIEISEPVEDVSTGMVNYEHFLISSQTSTQKHYVGLCLPNQNLYIEGPHHVWINRKMEEYFVLKNSRNGFLSDGMHTIDQDEMKEGVVLAMCFTTKPYKESLLRWWKYLQETNSSLSRFNVVFNIFDDVNRITVRQQLEA